MMYFFNAFYFVSNLLMRFGIVLERLAWRVSIRFGSLETLAGLLKRTDVPADMTDRLWSAYVKRANHIANFMRLLHPAKWGGGYPQWVRKLATEQIEEICLRRDPDPAWFGGDNPFDPMHGRMAYLVPMCDFTGLGSVLRMAMLMEMDFFYPSERKMMFPA